MATCQTQARESKSKSISKHVSPDPPMTITPLKVFKEQPTFTSSTDLFHAHDNHGGVSETKIHIHLQEVNKAIEDMLTWIGYETTTYTSPASTCSIRSSSSCSQGMDGYHDDPKLDYSGEKGKKKAPNPAGGGGHGDGSHENANDADPDDALFSKLKEMCIRDEYLDVDDGVQSQINTSIKDGDVMHHDTCACTCLDITALDLRGRLSRRYTTSQIIPENHHSDEVSMENDWQESRNPTTLRRAKTQVEVDSGTLLERRSKFLMERETYPYLA